MDALVENLSNYLSAIAAFGAGVLGALYLIFSLANISAQRVDPAVEAMENRLAEMDAPYPAATVRRWALLLGFGTALFFLLAWGHVVFAVIAVLAAIVVTRSYPGWVERRYMRNVEKDLANCLDIWVRCIRAGMSLQQAVDTATQDLRGPIQREMVQVQKDIRLSDIDTAMWRWHDRLPIDDIRYTVLGVVTCRQTGGKLSDVMENINASVHLRMEMREKVNALTSMGRSEAYAMAVMPAAICTLTYLMEPDMISNLFFTVIGVVGTLAMMCWEAIGVWVIWKIVNIKF